MPVAQTSDSPTSDLLRRIRGEFMEMPGLRLTGRQAQRLFGLNGLLCDAILTVLQDERFLGRTKDGQFVLMSART
jgi:hypothetical protein